MTYWKIEVTYRDASPAGTDMRHRAVVDAPSFDAAVDAVRGRLGKLKSSCVAGQVMDAGELEDVEAAIEGFVERGFAYRGPEVRERP
jgi:hypothetical protein